MIDDSFAKSVQQRFHAVVGRGADWLNQRGVQPNTLTWLSLAPAIASFIATAHGYLIAAVAMMALSGVCDLLDGPMARRSERTTLFGALLDSTLDRFADAAPLLGLVYYYGGYPLAALICALSAFSGYTVSYVRARAEGLQIALPWLWMRRTERLVLTGVGLLLSPIAIPALGVPAPVTLTFVLLNGVLALVAAFHALMLAERITTQSNQTRSDGQ